MTTTTVTTADVEYAFDAYVRTLQDHGLIRDGYRLELQHGSPSAGIGWRIYEQRVTGSTGLAEPLVGANYLGSSKRDAREALVDRRRIVADVLYAQRQNAEAEASATP